MDLALTPNKDRLVFWLKTRRIFLTVWAVFVCIAAVNIALSGNDVADRMRLALYMTIAAPITEEIVFRDILRSLFLRVAGPMATIVLCAAAFGLAHGYLWHMLGAHFVLWSSILFFMGLIFGASRERWGLIGAMTVHAGCNAFLLAVPHALWALILPSLTPTIGM